MTVQKPKAAPWLPDDWPVDQDGRRRLPTERPAVIHKFQVGGHEGYVAVGFYSETDLRPGEIFITMAKEGSTIRGLMDTIAKQTSLLLQYGVPVDAICDKFVDQQFEPRGIAIGHPDIKTAASIVDYVYRWLALRFGTWD